MDKEKITKVAQELIAELYENGNGCCEVSQVAQVITDLFGNEYTVVIRISKKEKNA